MKNIFLNVFVMCQSKISLMAFKSLLSISLVQFPLINKMGLIHFRVVFLVALVGSGAFASGQKCGKLKEIYSNVLMFNLFKNAVLKI